MKLIAVEATGHYEHRLVLALLDAGLPVAVLNPRRVAGFARALDQLAKTDALDARLLARFARQIEPQTPRNCSIRCITPASSLATPTRRAVGSIKASSFSLETSMPTKCGTEEG